MSEALHCPVYDVADVISMKIYKKASSLNLFFKKCIEIRIYKLNVV